MIHPLRAAILAAALAGEAALSADYELVSAVVVSRHGVRSPIGASAELAAIAAEPWPSWPVSPGHLTPRGVELSKLLGAFYREHYAGRGLLPAQGCPPQGAISAWADVDQRTRVTAQSLLDGMFPGCGLEPGYRVGATVDALFHPTYAGVCRIDPARAQQGVLARAGGGLATLQATFRPELTAMQSVLKCCGPALCRSSGAGASCVLGDLPSAIVGAHDGGSVRLSGPIAIGSTAAEIFLLQFAEGFPEHEVAWGRASTPQAMQPLLRLHTLQFDLMQRTPYLAARQGSGMVEAILSAMQRSIDGGTPNPPRLTLLVGHDTNLSNIGGMLGLHWSPATYLADQTPPAGALHFELLRHRPTDAHAVRVRFLVQTLDQMRRAVVLDRANPPQEAIATIEGCGTADGGACPWPAFASLAKAAIDRACVVPLPR